MWSNTEILQGHSDQALGVQRKWQLLYCLTASARPLRRFENVPPSGHQNIMSCNVGEGASGLLHAAFCPRLAEWGYLLSICINTLFWRLDIRLSKSWTRLCLIGVWHGCHLLCKKLDSTSRCRYVSRDGNVGGAFCTRSPYRLLRNGLLNGWVCNCATNVVAQSTKTRLGNHLQPDSLDQRISGRFMISLTSKLKSQVHVLVGGPGLSKILLGVGGHFSEILLSSIQCSDISIGHEWLVMMNLGIWPGGDLWKDGMF